MAGNCLYIFGVKMTTPKPLPTGLIDSLLADYKKPEDLIGEHGLLKQLTKALVDTNTSLRFFREKDRRLL